MSHQPSKLCIWNTQYIVNCVGVCNLIGRVNHPSDHSIKHMVLYNQSYRMIYNIHNENDWRQSVPPICMCNVDISRTIPTTLFLKTKYLKYHKISFKFRAITNLSCVPLNPLLIPRINIQKSNLYYNGFIFKKLIYWSEHTHTRPGWRPKSFSFKMKDLPLGGSTTCRRELLEQGSWEWVDNNNNISGKWICWICRFYFA